MTDGYPHNHHPDNWDLSTEMQRDLNHTRSQAEKEFIEVSNQAERNVSRIIDEQCDDTAEVVAAVGTAATAGALASAVSDQKNANKFYDAQKQLSDSTTATVVGFKDAQALAYQVQGQALLEAAKNFNAISVQNTSNFNLLQVQAQTFASAATLQAQTIASAAALAAQECCCELKEKITYDGQKTRDLINSIKEQDLRDRAQRAENSLAAYFAAKVAPVVP